MKTKSTSISFVESMLYDATNGRKLACNLHSGPFRFQTLQIYITLEMCF